MEEQKPDIFDVRKGQFKHGLDTETRKLRQEKKGNELRHSKRQEVLSKKRGMGATSTMQQWVKLDEHFKKVYTIEDLPHLLALSSATDAMSLLEMAQGLRKILSITQNPPVQNVIDGGAVPHLIRFIQLWQLPQVQYEAAWALTNISSGTSHHCKVILDKGATPHLVQLLDSPSLEVKEQAVWVLGNIASDSAASRDLALQFGALPKLISVLALAEKPAFRKNCSWAISNLCRGSPMPKIHKIAEALPVMVEFVMTSQDHEILADCCWALNNLSREVNIEMIDAFLATGVQIRLLQLVNHTMSTVQLPALRTLGNIIQGNEYHCTTLINAGVLAALLPVLSSPRKEIKVEAVWMLSNLSTGTAEHISAIFASGVYTRLISMLLGEEATDIKRDIIWTICNSTSIANPTLINQLVTDGAIQAISGLLELSESRLLVGALECLGNILNTGAHYATNEQGGNIFALQLENCGGLDKIDALQNHSNNQVYKKALEIIENYYETEENEDDDLIASIKAISAEQTQGTLTYSF